MKQNSNIFTPPTFTKDQIEEWSISKPLFYNYIQYISLISMLFNPEYFYLYQSKTTQFYIILTIYGDKRIINKIYDSIEYLLSDNCKSNKYLFTQYSFLKWKQLIYMNNELLYKVTQYLSLIIAISSFESQSITSP